MIQLSESARQERDEIVGWLSGLIGAATADDLGHIARADRHASARDGQKHLAALNTVIFKRGGRMTEKHDWFPGEALSLVAHDPDGHEPRVFGIATALLMLNALLDDDADGTMSIYWEEVGARYRDIDRDFVRPVLRGFLWLSQHATEWSFLHDPGTVAPVPDRDEIEALATPPVAVRKQAAPPGLG